MGCEVTAEPSTTVGELKDSTIQKMNLAPLTRDQLRFIYKGKVLKDDNTLESYDVQEGGAIHMVKSAPPPTSTTAPSTASQPGGVPTSNTNPFAAAFGQQGQGAPGASPFGGMGGMGGLSPEMMQQMMNNPMVDQMLNNPELIQQMMNSNPQMQAMLDANPHIRQIMNDPEMIRHSMQMMRNPQAMREAMRHQDMAMSQLENHPEGYNALRRMYEDVQEPMMQAQQQAFSMGSNTNNNSGTTNTPSSSSPNTSALPNPWGAPAAGAQSNPFGALGGIGGMPGGMGGMPGGMGGMPGGLGGMGGMMNPQMMAMMNNPAMQQQMQQMLQNPAMLDQIAAMNPQLGNMLQNPQVRAMMSDPNFLQQAMNPANMQAMMNMQQSMQQLQSSGLMPGMGGLGGMNGQFGGLDFSGVQGLGGNIPASTTTPAPPVDPAVRFASQIVQLNEMGFSDDARNIQALTQTQGNVNAAVERLLGGM